MENKVNEVLAIKNSSKKLLKWKPKIRFKDLVKDMLDSDINYIKKQIY